MDRELSLFIGAHLILVWNEVKISRLKRDGFAGSLPRMSAEVCWGDPNKSAFEGSQGWIRRTGKLTHTQAPLAVSGYACQSQRCHFSGCSAFITWFSAFWAVRLQDYANPWAANCNHNILKSVRLIARHTHTHTQTKYQQTLPHFSAAFSIKNIHDD